MSSRLYSLAFVTAAVFNVAVGAAGVLFYELTVRLLFGPEAVTGGLVAGVFYRLFMVAVLVFGVGYFLVSRDLELNRGIVWLGAVSKLVIAAVLLTLVTVGLARPLILAVVVPDLGFMILFFYFLWQTHVE